MIPQKTTQEQLLEVVIATLNGDGDPMMRLFAGADLANLDRAIHEPVGPGAVDI